MEHPNGQISVVGAGAVGTSLAALLKKAGYEIRGISTRTEDRLTSALDFLDLPRSRGFLETGDWCYGVDLLLITVPDDIIGPVAESLAEKELTNQETLAVHCSGAHGAGELLGPLMVNGTRIGAFHPLQTVPDPAAGTKSIPGCWIALDGKPEVIDELKQIVRSIDARPFVVPEKHRTLYHAAAVFACNYTIALISIAEQLMETSAGEVEHPLDPLTPLIEKSINNALTTSPSEILTGPAVRGDVETLRRHLHSLKEEDDRLPSCYLELSIQCLNMAVESGRLDEKKKRQIVNQLEEIE